MTSKLPDNFEGQWPWMRGFRRIVSTVAEPRLCGDTLFSACDFSGSHKQSKYNVYSFVLIDPSRSEGYFHFNKQVRETFLRDRRMSFKSLNDKRRRDALVPFLEASEEWHGVCCSIAGTKSFKYMATKPSSVSDMTDRLNLRGNWKRDVFETAMRAVIFWSIILAEVSEGRQNVTWILDEDDITANDVRHSDLLRMTSFVAPHFIRREMGELCVCTTASEGSDIWSEDLNAVADLAAGAFCEAVNLWSRLPHDQSLPDGAYSLTTHSNKTDLINDWFFFSSPGLRKAAILIDAEADGSTSIKKVDLKR